MLLAINTILLALAGLLVFWMWRRAAAYGRAATIIVTAGVIGRGVAGIVLFWISYLRLPFVRSLQMGDGFWFFAPDGVMYFTRAVEAAQRGLGGIILYNRTAPSVFFIQTLSLFTLLFGSVASVAILLNVCCFLATALILLRWSSAATGKIGVPVLVPLAALALSPAAILWSLQPLKDPLFSLLIVAIAASFAAWQHEWLSGDTLRPWRVLANGAAIWALLWAIAAVRWYFALVVWGASLVLAVVLCALVKNHRKECMAASAALFIMLAPAFLYGGGPYIPEWISRALSPRSASFVALAKMPVSLLHDVDQSRKAFDRVGGATVIRIAAPAPRPQLAAAKPAPQPRKRALPPPMFSSAAERTAAPKTTVAAKSATGSSSAADVPSSGKPEVSNVASLTNPPAAASTNSEPSSSAKSAAAKASSAQSAAPKSDAAQSAARKAEATKSAAAKSATAKSVASETPARPSKTEPAPAVVRPAAPVVAVARKPVPPPARVAQAQPEEGDNGSRVLLPQSPLARVTAGCAAIVLPRLVAQRLHLIDIRGGRGMWLFVDVDTIAFDIILLLALYSFIRGIASGSIKEPLFWQIALTTIFVAGPIIYAISNFGTLFRHRGMIYVGLALIPLALARTAKRPAAEDARSTPLERQTLATDGGVAVN